MAKRKKKREIRYQRVIFAGLILTALMAKLVRNIPEEKATRFMESIRSFMDFLLSSKPLFIGWLEACALLTGSIYLFYREIRYKKSELSLIIFAISLLAAGGDVLFVILKLFLNVGR